MRSVTLRCDACGFEAAPLAEEPRPFTCSRAAKDGADHVLAPALGSALPTWPSSADSQPFLRFAPLLFVHQAALELGLGEDGYREAVLTLDAAIERVDGRGLRVTPASIAPSLEALTGAETWVKDETNNVSGSHKARHLFGVGLYLALVRAAGLEAQRPRLAIASCGNAALAAAVVARAGELPLDTFVPPDAAPAVVSRLRDLGALVHTCERAAGELGDPCVRAFRDAVAAGAIPFGCQGPDNGITLDGGRTLAFEVVELARQAGQLERVFVQVGGGALASSLARGLEDARRIGVIDRLPRLHPVQTERVAPLLAAYEKVLAGLGEAALPPPGDERSDLLRARPLRERVEAQLALGAGRRAHLLEPWPRPQPSVAHGILDDDTYDGLAILRATFASGGAPVAVAEPTLALAAAALNDAGIAADETGAAGLAGLVTWAREHGPLTNQRALVLATGHRR